MNKKDNRERILATAFNLFFNKGYKEVTMSDLVKESGLSKGAFYHYFNSKEELYNHSMEVFIDGYMKNATLDFDPDISLRKNLIEYIKRFAPVHDQMNNSNEESYEAMSKYLIFIQGLMKKKEFRDRLTEYNRIITDQFAAWIYKAQNNGEIVQEPDALILANHLISLMKGIGVMHSFVDGEESMQVKFSKIINQFFDLLEKK